MGQLKYSWTILILLTLAAMPAVAQTAAPPSDDRAAFRAAFEETLRKPADPPTLLRYAELAVKVGDLEAAISALERLLLIEGDQPRVKLELGVLYFRLGSYEAARGYLEGARASASATAETKERAGQYLADIDSKTGKSHFSGELLNALRYSTNANSGPGGLLRSFGANTISTPTISGRPDFSFLTSAAIRHRYDLGRQDSGAMETDLSIYSARQIQVSEANVIFLDVITGPRTQPFEGWLSAMSVKPFVTGRYLAVHDLTTYWAWGAGMEAAAPIGEHFNGALTLFGRRREFVNNSDVPTNNASSGNEGVGFLELRAQLSAAMTLTLSTNYTRFLAMVPSESYGEFGFGATFAARFADPLGINGRIWLATLGATYEHADYDQVDVTVDPGTVRRHNDYNFSLVLAVPLDDRFTVVTQAAYARREASINNFAYDAFTALAGISWRF